MTAATSTAATAAAATAVPAAAATAVSGPVDWRALLAELSDAVRASQVPDEPEGHTVAAAALALADAWPSPACDHRATLDALNRKVHVAKTTLARYGRGWKRKKGAEPLRAETWRLLIAVFFAYAGDAYELHHIGDAVATPADEARFDHTGMALKCLNAGLAAHRRAAALQLPELPSDALAELAHLGALRLAALPGGSVAATPDSPDTP